MKQKDLRSLKKNPEIARQIENMDPNSVTQIQQAVEQYQGKSETELYDELRRKVDDGSLDTARVNDLAQQLVPLLNPAQQQRLNAIIQNLKR